MKFGEFGGRYVPEVLIPPLEELGTYYDEKVNHEFFEKMEEFLKEYAGRPTPLYFAKNLSNEIKGAKIYLKREDLLHGGAHKINNTIGQALLAKRMGKERLIAETGAGQHGVATSMAGALFDMKTEIFMGAKDVKRQKENVQRIELLGGQVISVESGNKTLKDAINETLREWIGSFKKTHYLIGSVVGPHPYPKLVRDFQSIIGKETKRQIEEKEDKIPDRIIACIGGGSNALGIFYPFLNTSTELIGVEAGGKGIESDEHSSSVGKGKPGVLHGMLTYLLQDEKGQIKKTHSIAPGLDYVGVGPEHAYFNKNNIVKYENVEDRDAVDAYKALCKFEGILPALESAHALAYAIDCAKEMNEDEIIIVNLSGRGDKDIDIIKGDKNDR